MIQIRLLPNIPGDESKSCRLLKAEIAQIEAEVITKQNQKSTKDFWNTAEFIGGFFLIIPWFFMDVKGAEQAEAEALKIRANRLAMIAADKNCDLTGVKDMEPTPAK